MPIVGSYCEVVSHTLYDTEQMVPGKVSLFQVPAGVDGKTEVKTNMYRTGLLPHPQRFQIEDMRCSFFCAGRVITPNDPIWTDVSLTLLVHSKVYREGPAWEFISPMCALACHNESELRKSAWVKRFFELHAKRKLKEKVFIDEGQYFNVEARSDRSWLHAGLEIMVSLDGQLFRPIM